MRRTQELFAWLIALVLIAGASWPSEARAQEDLRGILPFIMLVVDTSGSMERLPTCPCTTPGCEECVPQCGLANNTTTGLPPANKKNRWALTLEALTGTFANFECEGIERTAANNMTYDLGFHLPYFQPWDCRSQPAGTRCAFDATNSTRVQNSDGILDLNESAIRFGLMTFDGWDTMLGYPPLVSVDDFEDAISLSEGVQGLWSYGGAKSFHYPNCTTDYMMDTGARSDVAPEGGLISIESCTGGGTPGGSPTCPAWCSTCSSTSQTINRDIQEALLATRPYGGTPIAASLDDLYYHFDEDLDDDFSACRDRFALLITDGYPDDDYRSFGCNCANEPGGDCGPNPPNNPSDMHCPYPTSEDAARFLVSGNGPSKPPVIERLYVLGLAVDDPVVVERLNTIANNGCKELDAVCTEGHPGNQHALFANDLSTLRTAVQDIVDDNNRPISRTIPVFANSNDPTTPQYQFTSGLTLPTQQDEPWQGVLERRRFVCSGTTPGYQNISASQGDVFDATLDAQGTRTLLTALPPSGGGTTPIVTQAMLSGAPNPEYWNTAAVSCIGGCTMTSLENVDVALLNASSAADGQNIKDWMYARSSTPRENAALGAIFHSNPVVSSPPRIDSGDDLFNAWRRTDAIELRPQVLYVGTNDGMIHAFSTGDYEAPDAPPDPSWRDLDAGEELWGFIPPMLLPRIGTSRTVHQTLMDGTPVVRNVYTDRTRTGGGYKTVLITGMREGGNGYVALDVTNPFEPEFLWQVTDSQMGMTYGQPAIVQATFTRPIGGVSGQVRSGAVAILPGGTGRVTSAGQPLAFGCNGATAPQMRQGSLPFNTQADSVGSATTYPHRQDVRCWEPTGRALYFVDVADGYLIKKISLPDPASAISANNIPVFASPMVSTPAPFPDEIGLEATRAFVTDADGVIWRIDLRADEADRGFWDRGWTARPFHDIFHPAAEPTTPAPPFAGELTYEPPMLSTDSDGRAVVIVGTGDNGNFTKPAVRNRVVSLTEIEVSGVPIDSVGHWKGAFNWEMLQKSGTRTSQFSDGTTVQVDGLATSELVTGPMVLFEGQLFFSTFIAVTDPDNVCAFGRGRIHAVSYNLADINDVNPSGTRGPLRINASTGSANSIINVIQTNPAGDNVMIMGLTLTQQPSCRQADLTVTDPWGTPWSSVSAPGSPPPMYLAAHAAFDNHGSSLVDDVGGSRVFSAEINIKRPPSQTTVLSWATSIE